MCMWALSSVQEASVRQLKVLQPGRCRRSVQIPSESVLSFFGAAPLLWCVTVPGWTWWALSSSTSSLNTLLYHEAPCWGWLEKTTTEKKKNELIIQLLLLKQRDNERSSLSVILFLSGCRCSAVIKEITDCFTGLLERGSAFESGL